MVTASRSTEKKQGRVADGLRDFASYMMMAGLATPQDTPQNQSEELPSTTTSKKEVAPTVLFRNFGYPKSTGYRDLKKLKQKRKVIRKARNKVQSSIWKMTQSRIGFWKKISVELRMKIDKWIRSHPLVVHSPNKADTKFVIDPFTLQKVRKNRLLLSCSVRELHREMYHGELKLDRADLYDANGKELVSDTMFRKILPPELKLLSGTHKQGCCCETCTSMSNLQSAYNRTQVCIRMKKEKDVKQLE